MDGKDIWLSNIGASEGDIGYNIKDRDGHYNTGRFGATLDYSIELMKLRDVYRNVYRNSWFSFQQDGKEYSKFVVSLTFKYSVKKYNKIRKDTYIKLGFDPANLRLKDHIQIENGEVVAVQVGHPVENPVSASILGKYISYVDGQYQIAKTIPAEISVADIRRHIYEHGFYLDGTHYVRYKRSSGSSRVGKCLFIADRLYPQIHKLELCGLNIKPGDQVDLAAFESYISLTLSSIIGMVEIQPSNILVIDDYYSIFKDDVINVKEENGFLVAGQEEVEVSNSIWDGQSLIDPSLMGEYSEYGYILLRNNFFKSAAFNFQIQRFFQDHGITRIEQLNGQTTATDISEIKLITTPSSIKYLKFGSLEDWLYNVSPLYGVVKHEKPTHYFNGRLVQTHYQLLNTLQMSETEVGEFLKESLDYLWLLRTNLPVFRHHIGFAYNGFDYTPASSKNGVVYKMLGVTDRFAKTKLFRDFQRDVVDSYVKNLKCGHVLVEGNYSTMCGNPIEMAMSAIGKFDGHSALAAGTIHSTRFADGEQLIGSRSPHVCMGNVWLPRNKHNPSIANYMNMTSEIVAVNSIGENLLNRLSGCDFDSDSVMLSNNKFLIRAAQKNYERFRVPSGSVHTSKMTMHYTAEDLSALDIRTSVNKIGEIVNLSQELNSLLWEKVNSGAEYDDVHKLYCDISLLDVLSNVEIDRAKRESIIDSTRELARIRERYARDDTIIQMRAQHDGEHSVRTVKPEFIGHIAKQKGYFDKERKMYIAHNTTMDHVQACVCRARWKRTKRSDEIPFSDIVSPSSRSARTYHNDVSRILSEIQQTHNHMKQIWRDSGKSSSEKYSETTELRQRCIEIVDGMNLSTATMRYLLLQIESPQYKDISRTIFFTLFGSPNRSFFKLILESCEPVVELIEDEGGEIMLYNARYSPAISGDYLQKMDEFTIN